MPKRFLALVFTYKSYTSAELKHAYLNLLPVNHDVAARLTRQHGAELTHVSAWAELTHVAPLSTPTELTHLRANAPLSTPTEPTHLYAELTHLYLHLQQD